MEPIRIVAVVDALLVTVSLNWMWIELFEVELASAFIRTQT